MAETGHAQLHITKEEARRIASLLRYAVSFNTTAGLLHPTERRLTTPTYRAVELAALVLEGKTFEEAVQEAGEAWTGSLEEDHRRALNLLQSTREALQSAMTGFMGPEQFTEYFEISQRQFLELIKSNMPKPPETQKHLK
ncbi:MAG: hypothetical protein M3305_04430 [Actinomycetota bacterium]|nr:hypothetical protein [Actinomycetota bacterium]